MIRKPRQSGFSLIEVMIVLVIMAVIMAIAIPMMREALVRGMIGSAVAESRTIHNAIKRYHVDVGYYPDSGGFDTSTFEPLGTMGYYDGRLAPRILNGSLDGYGSPSNGQEYWLEFTLRHEPSVRFLVSDSDDGPLSGGTFHDGIMYFRKGVLQPL